MVMPLGFESVQIKESMRTKFEQSKRLMILLFQKKGNSQQENWLENNPSLESLNPSETHAPISSLPLLPLLSFLRSVSLSLSLSIFLVSRVSSSLPTYSVYKSLRS